jgi:hypothetical protein
MLLSSFVTLTIYGMAYRLWPAMKKSPLALAQFWITVIGSAGVIVASYLLVTRANLESRRRKLIETPLEPVDEQIPSRCNGAAVRMHVTAARSLQCAE